MQNQIEDENYEDIAENYDCEIQLPDNEFDDLVKTFEERQKVRVEYPEDLVFYVEKDLVRYKVTRKNDGSILH